MTESRTDRPIPTPEAKVEGTASVLHEPGAVRLDDYPLLVCAPGRWGPGVRTEDHGVPVEDLAAAAANPDHDLVAWRFGTTAAHVADAIRYAAAAGSVPAA